MFDASLGRTQRSVFGKESLTPASEAVVYTSDLMNQHKNV